MTKRLASLVILLCASTVALTACGRKTDLLTPSQAAAEARRDAARRGEPVPAATEPQAPDRRFILDGLID